MKSTFRFGFAILLVVFACGATWSQSLGDYARSVKKEKSQQPATKKVYDNDNLPKTDHLSTVGPPAEEPPQSASDEEKPEQVQASPPSATESQVKEAAGEKAEANSTEKEWKDWQQKIAKQKEAVALAEREADVLDREYRLRAAAFYADAGNRLRNQAQWDKQDSEYRAQSEEKRKQVEAEKQKLSDLQEAARKAGVPARYRE
jgi:hypothetical protein